jgi:hypothetical protein
LWSVQVMKFHIMQSSPASCHFLLLLGPDIQRSIPSWGRDFFPFITAPIPALGSTRPHIRWISWVLSPRLKRPCREANHSPPPSAEV